MGALIDYPVVILGERHHKPESGELVVQVARAMLKRGSCLDVALEIRADHQDLLNAAMEGEIPVEKVPIHPIIDHPAYRQMLKALAGLVQAGGCLKVLAIDAPWGAKVSRDAWMACALLGRERPVLVLLGNLHALKKARWVNGMDDPFLAERLVRAGVDVFSAVQVWEGEEKGEGTWVSALDDRALGYVKKEASVAAIGPPETALE
ncbi:MAG: hypothetical protein D6791_18580, partial [Chloroflexi bacterium]